MPFVGKLRNFQKPGRNAILKRKRVLIAYHMGLGKTPLTISATERLLDKGRIDHVLVIAPASLKYQWKNQLAKFTGDKARSAVVDGDAQRRRGFYRSFDALRLEYLIVNPEQIINDWAWFKSVRWHCIVLDEATCIKGFTALRSKRIKKLRAPYRVALSGQPVENRPEEMYSILQWVDASVFGDFEVFDETFIKRDYYGRPKYYRNLDLFRQRLEESGVMVRKRRDDPDVAAEMPKVVVMERYPEFDTAGRALNRRISDSLVVCLGNMVGGSNFNLFAHYGADAASDGDMRGDVMRRVLALRQLCAHPELLRISADRYERTEGQKGSAYALELREEGLLDRKFKTPKLDELKRLVEDIVAEDPTDKVVIFTSFATMLPLLDDALRKHGDCVHFRGGMSAKRKDAAVQRFYNDPRAKFFISTDAGGYGVDLPNARHLINYDLPWSAGAMAQRNSRNDRLSTGAEKTITTSSLLIEGSIDVWMYHVLLQKARVGSAFVDGHGINSAKAGGEVALTVAGLKEFLEDGVLETAKL